MELIRNKELIDFSIEASGDRAVITREGKPKSYKFNKLSCDEFSFVLSTGKAVATVAEDEKKIYVRLDGRSFTFDKVLDEDKSFEAAAGDADGEEIYPPMPGSVVKILCQVGQEVAEGEGLIVVEAMKMETTLYASVSGVVEEINAEEGAQVGSDDVLIKIGKAE